MEHLSTLVQSIASLGWVAFAFVALFTFKSEITRALPRLKKGKILGQEFELTGELNTLENSAEQAAKEVRELPQGDNPVVIARQGEEIDTRIKQILQQATSSPKLALIALRAELERQAVNGLAIRGLLRGRRIAPLKQALVELRQYGLPAALEGSLELFDSARNKIVHGAGTTDDDALRALDSGLTILRALAAMPSETHVVDHPGVEIFSDPQCTQLIPGVKGVILEATSPGGAIKTKRIYATTQTHFQKGKQVAWEWNSGMQWSKAWYRDPDTGAFKSAWDGCAEFIGRHLDDITGVSTR
jgi:hypothetical protein